MSPSSKTIVVVLVLTLSAVFPSSDKVETRPQTDQILPFQGRERAIVKKRDFDPPVLINEVKTKGRTVPLSRKFLDDDDWLKGFAVSVRNASNKSVSHIGIEMLFRPVGQPGVLPAGWFLDYGPNPFHFKTGEAMPTSSVPSVTQGEEVEVKLSDTQFKDLKTFLREAGFPDKIHVVEIRVNTIGFSDGTAWFGKMLKRDSGNQSGWTTRHLKPHGTSRETHH